MRTNKFPKREFIWGTKYFSSLMRSRYSDEAARHEFNIKYITPLCFNALVYCYLAFKQNTRRKKKLQERHRRHGVKEESRVGKSKKMIAKKKRRRASEGDECLRGRHLFAALKREWKEKQKCAARFINCVQEIFCLCSDGSICSYKVFLTTYELFLFRSCCRRDKMIAFTRVCFYFSLLLHD